MPVPAAKESYIQVLNLADSDIKVTMQDYNLLQRPFRPYQVSSLALPCYFRLAYNAFVLI